MQGGISSLVSSFTVMLNRAVMQELVMVWSVRSKTQMENIYTAFSSISPSFQGNHQACVKIGKCVLILNVFGDSILRSTQDTGKAYFSYSRESYSYVLCTTFF